MILLPSSIILMDGTCFIPFFVFLYFFSLFVFIYLLEQMIQFFQQRLFTAET